ncbi:tRNA-dihydrouridine(16/17) synthase [NAD(P)(+)]-like [Elysia marginata]|uniref:tRNA-dihydrouridine(16/17) synthase [NAD(P)(+)] n=1 Tax=Elysia marginata TaxID=1093978 RepID=A0AAV4FGR1_9GAST|nr:tRNA-dihydrouridine(16/17) synthase [NAD(P)(+)]-like [Elysia marginata]
MKAFLHTFILILLLVFQCLHIAYLSFQFCCNDPDTFLKAALLAESHCDAIDLNLGCPQVIAKRGHYGAFLQDEWDLIAKMVKTCHENLSVPITCKVRIFPSVEKTVQYAKMLEAAGCQLLTVHGRTREQKGRFTGIADWSYIAAVREAVSIPVFANGNIQYLDDVHRCLKETGAEGVMTAEGNLHNPALFHGLNPSVWEMLREYLDYVKKYPCPLSYMRGHAFKLCQHALTTHKHLRDLFASAKDVNEFREAADKLRDASQADVEKFKEDPLNFKQELELPLPYWICQPYVRPSPHEERIIDPENREMRKQINLKRAENILKINSLEAGFSMNKIKKMLKNPYKNHDPALKPKFEPCIQCKNPKGLKCEFNLCKTCCRERADLEMKGCIGHNIRRKDLSEVEYKPSPNSHQLNNNCETNGKQIAEKNYTPESVVNCSDMSAGSRTSADIDLDLKAGSICNLDKSTSVTDSQACPADSSKCGLGECSPPGSAPPETDSSAHALGSSS